MNSAPSPSQSRAAGDGIDQIAASVRSGQVVLFLGAGVHASKPALPGQPDPPPDPRRPLFAGALAEALAGETRWTERFPNKPPKDHFQRVALYYELSIILDEQLKDWEQKGKAQGLPPCGTTSQPQQKKGGSAGTRTRNQRLKRALLYRLSYRPVRETSLKYIAANRNIVRDANRRALLSDENSGPSLRVMNAVDESLASRNWTQSAAKK